MIFHSLGLRNKDQRGFTIIELLVALAITGLITGGVTMTIFQVFAGNARTSNHMTAVRQVQSAGYWISHDAQMAQSVAPDPGASGFPLTLTWTEYGVDGDEHQVVYTLASNKLQREHYTNRATNPTPDATTFVADHIDTANTSCALDGSKLTLTVTASIGGFKPASETRVYEIVRRPDEVY